VNPVPRWRIAAAIAVLAALLGFGILFVPIYVDNLKLQSFVAEMTQRADSRTQNDEALRQTVVSKAVELDLPVKADNVHINRTAEGLRIDVRYFVRVNVPGYTVDLHFYPGAGSR
jgi:archaellum component FlaF (FlaF/FlaG flagellin family)